MSETREFNTDTEHTSGSYGGVSDIFLFVVFIASVAIICTNLPDFMKAERHRHENKLKQQQQLSRWSICMDRARKEYKEDTVKKQ